MDHISKALERAQAERRSVRDWVLSSSSEANELPASQTQGRTVTLSAEHLKQRHVLCGLGLEDPIMSAVYRQLRTQVVQLMRRHDWRVVGITSSRPKAGKSLTAINLAISMARDNSRRVALVDADIRRPSIADTLGIDSGIGLIDYLTTDIPVRDALTRLEREHLTIVPGRPDTSSSVKSELLMSKKMGDLIQDLRGRDQSSNVVVDLAPVLMGDDVLVLAPLLDCLLIVVEEGKSQIGELREVAELVKGFNVLGIVVNKSEKKKDDFGGYYYHATDVAT